MTFESEGNGRKQEGDVVASVLIPTSADEREFDDLGDSLGIFGRPFDHRSPFFIGLNAAPRGGDVSTESAMGEVEF
jgi:hypothetical protein